MTPDIYISEDASRWALALIQNGKVDRLAASLQARLDAAKINAKGKGRPQRGERHHRAKLTDREVDLMRAAREANPDSPLWVLATFFDVSTEHARSITSYRRRA